MSPLLAGALGAAGGFYLLGAGWPAPALFLAALAVTISRLDVTRARVLCVFAVGLVLGGALSGRPAGPPSGVNLDPSTVTAADAELIEDSRTVSGSARYRLRVWVVSGVLAGNPVQVATDAVMALTVADGATLSAGTRIRVAPISLQSNEAGMWGFASADAITVTGAPSGVSRFRATVRAAIMRSCRSVGPDAGALLTALYLGTVDELSVRITTLFRDAGASHILALSGMHLGVLMGIVLILIRPLAGQRVASVAAVGVAFVFLVVVGARPSLVRGVIMLTLAIAFRLSDRRVTLLEILAMSFLLQLVLAPASADLVSFKLSYLALAGIAVISPEVERTLRPWIPAVLRQPIAAGIGAQIATAPVVAAAFGVIAPIGVATALVLTPIVLLLMIFGIPVAAMASVGGAAAGGRLLLSPLYRVAETVAWFFAGAPRLTHAGVSIAAAVAVTCGAACIGAACLRGRAAARATAGLTVGANA